MSGCVPHSFGPTRMQATFATIRHVQQEADIEAISLLNFVVSDGVTMVATRFASDPNEAPASLYYAEGGKYQRAADSAPANGQLDAAVPGDDTAANAQTARRSSLTGTHHPPWVFTFGMFPAS